MSIPMQTTDSLMQLAIALTIRSFDQTRCEAERQELAREAWAILSRLARSLD